MWGHTLIDIEGNAYNVELKIENNKLYAIWDTEKSEINLNKNEITIQGVIIGGKK